jgi:hypothetical protein
MKRQRNEYMKYDDVNGDVSLIGGAVHVEME